MLSVAVALVAAAVVALPAHAANGPARLQVTADEFAYLLSRQRLRTGPALVELVNLGEDEHDLRLRRVGGTRTYSLTKVLPGERRGLSARLLPGRFRLWCSLADHAERGMSASLRVR